jgi:hypothetical protein
MGEIADDLTRRGLLARAGSLGLGAIVASAVPLVRGMVLPDSALAEPNVADATLQAYFDTIIPGRVVATTALGNEVHPGAIAGVDDRPGAVEADSLALAHHPAIGFDALSPAFLVDLEARAVGQGGDFLSLGFPARVAVCTSGLDFANPLRLVWEAAAAVPFTAFCAAALIRNATDRTAVGYAVMGLPGVAPDGYGAFSYGRALARERTRAGSLR